MATLKYGIKRNTTLVPNSYYAQAKTYSTLSIDDIAEQLVESFGLSRYQANAVLERLGEIILRMLLLGHRVNIPGLGTFYPGISVSVKDVLDDGGNVVTKATADKLDVKNGRSYIGFTVAQSVQQKFASSVSWKKDGDDDTATTTSTDGGTDGSTTTTDDTTTSTGSGEQSSSDSGEQSSSGSGGSDSGSANL